MNLKRWTALATIAIGILLIASGCGRVNLFAGESPTSPPTRTPRPTFTLRPEDTQTTVSTEVPTETDTAVPPTDTAIPPTRRPVATARPRATAPPAATPIPATVGPTTSPYQYLFYPLSCSPGDDPALCNIQNGGVKCFHSGNHYIDAYVAANQDPTSVLAGVKVRFSGSQGGTAIVDMTTGGDGKASFTLTAPGVPLVRSTGNYFAWVINNSGDRISDFSPPIPINALSETQSNVCISAQVAFAGH